jgi:hypothetical protein
LHFGTFGVPVEAAGVTAATGTEVGLAEAIVSAKLTDIAQSNAAAVASFRMVVRVEFIL